MPIALSTTIFGAAFYLVVYPLYSSTVPGIALGLNGTVLVHAVDVGLPEVSLLYVLFGTVPMNRCRTENKSCTVTTLHLLVAVCEPRPLKQLDNQHRCPALLKGI